MANPLSHTLSAVRIIKRELAKIKKILNIVVQVLFLAYFLYLIFSNLNSLSYVIIYSLILSVSLASILIEPVYKIDTNDEKSVIRSKKKQKRIALLFLKSMKYICKLVAILIAVYEISSHGSSDLSILATIGSGILLLIQVFVDSIVLLVNRYVDLLQLALEEDVRSSKLIQFVLNFNHKDYVNELKEDQKTYTEEEKRIIYLLENADRLEEEKQSKKKIKAVPVNKEILELFSNLKKDATHVLENKKERKKLIKDAEKLSFFEDSEESKKIPPLISFLKSFFKKGNSKTNMDTITSVTASLLYLTKKDEIEKEKGRPLSKDDDLAILKQTYEEISPELEVFQTEKKEKKGFFWQKRKEKKN